jgi:hypothetical protein
MKPITFELSDEAYQALEASAREEERTPQAQAKIFVLEALGLRRVSPAKSQGVKARPKATARNGQPQAQRTLRGSTG